jgi:hypothetical protein
MLTDQVNLEVHGVGLAWIVKYINLQDVQLNKIFLID